MKKNQPYNKNENDVHSNFYKYLIQEQNEYNKIGYDSNDNNYNKNSNNVHKIQNINQNQKY
jgi:hypothetical protein